MKEIELKDLQEQLDPMRDLVGDLTALLARSPIANACAVDTARKEHPLAKIIGP
jgi:hypothetical protein